MQQERNDLEMRLAGYCIFSLWGLLGDSISWTPRNVSIFGLNHPLASGQEVGRISSLLLWSLTRIERERPCSAWLF